MRHSWTGNKCRRCCCLKQPVCWVGRGLILWTYITPDGTRFTGQAPDCTPVAGAAFDRTAGDSPASNYHTAAAGGA